MISKATIIRPGMTAIAAVIALSSTPVFAQDAVPQTSPGAVPTQVTPPAVVPTAPSASVPTTVAPPVATVTPQPAAPVIEVTPPTAATPVPVETAPPVATAAPERSARAATPRAETARPAASQRTATPAAPVEARPVTPPAAVEATPAAAPLPVEAAPIEEAAPPAAATAMDDTLPLVGAGALAVLALGAAGFALSRRRRRDEVFVDETVEAEPVMADPIAPPAPAFAREAVPSPVAVAAPASAAALPNGFDISRYGRHVQAAYRGPTPDNPFVSLKKRLTRAHFYDMQEARAAQAGSVSTPPAQAPAPRPVQDRFEVRSPARGNAQIGGFRPAFQR